MDLILSSSIIINKESGKCNIFISMFNYRERGYRYAASATVNELQIYIKQAKTVTPAKMMLNILFKTYLHLLNQFKTMLCTLFKRSTLQCMLMSTTHISFKC